MTGRIEKEMRGTPRMCVPCNPSQIVSGKLPLMNILIIADYGLRCQFGTFFLKRTLHDAVVGPSFFVMFFLKDASFPVMGDAIIHNLMAVS